MKIPKGKAEGMTAEDQEIIQNEIHMITKLKSHPHIVRVVDFIPHG